MWWINSWQPLGSSRHTKITGTRLIAIVIGYKTPFCSLCTYSQDQILMASQDNLLSVLYAESTSQWSCPVQLFRPQSYTIPPLPTPSPPSNCFLLSRITNKNKHLVSLWQHTLESLFHHFSRWEIWRGDKKENKLFFSISFHFFQVWENSGHRATRMIWLWKLLISPSKESQPVVTEHLARSPKGLPQRDPPGSCEAVSAQGTAWGRS